MIYRNKALRDLISPLIRWKVIQSVPFTNSKSDYFSFDCKSCRVLNYTVNRLPLHGPIRAVWMCGTWNRLWNLWRVKRLQANSQEMKEESRLSSASRVIRLKGLPWTGVPPYRVRISPHKHPCFGTLKCTAPCKNMRNKEEIVILGDSFSINRCLSSLGNLSPLSRKKYVSLSIFIFVLCHIQPQIFLRLA